MPRTALLAWILLQAIHWISLALAAIAARRDLGPDRAYRAAWAIAAVASVPPAAGLALYANLAVNSGSTTVQLADERGYPAWSAWVSRYETIVRLNVIAACAGLLMLAAPPYDERYFRLWFVRVSGLAAASCGAIVSFLAFPDA